MTTQTRTYKNILSKLPKNQKAKAKFYNNREGYFAITYRNKFLGWASPAVMKPLIQKNLVIVSGIY